MRLVSILLGVMSCRERMGKGSEGVWVEEVDFRDG